MSVPPTVDALAPAQSLESPEVEHRGFVLIADITGYTMYLTESELAHAQGTLTDLLELLVDTTRAPFVVAQLEGDAVMSYAFEDGFVDSQTFLERVEETYIEFRRAIDLMVLNNTCECNACANVSALDLKFFVHHGAFVIQPVGEMRQLVGTDVNLIHRLLKNEVTAETGFRAYLLLTEAATTALNVDPHSENFVAHLESVSDFGDLSVRVKDMHPAYEAAREFERLLYEPEEVLKTLVTDIPLPIESVWAYANQSEFRNLLIGSDSYEVLDRRSGRITEGSTYQCYHGNMTVTQVVLDWVPFERVALRQMIFSGKTTTILDLRFAPSASGTSFSQIVTKPSGPPVRRMLFGWLLRFSASRAQKMMDEFRERIIDDYNSRASPDDAPLPLERSVIQQAAAAGVRTGQLEPEADS